MLRELATMSADEVGEWAVARKAEIIASLWRRDISEEVATSLMDWADDNYCSYLTAVAEGLILPSQVTGEKTEAHSSTPPPGRRLREP